MVDARHLIRPTAAYRDSYIEALREGFASGGDPVPDAQMIAAVEADFDAHLRSLDRDGQTRFGYRGRDLTGVLSNTFWLVGDGAFIGSISIRSRIDTPF